MAHGPGQVGRDARAQAVFRSLQTDILSHPFSVYKCYQQLRTLLQLNAYKYAGRIFLRIIENPSKLYLLVVFMLLGCWETFESMKVPGEHGDGTVDDFINALQTVSSRLAARNMIRECRKWEESLTPTMKAARAGNFITFIAGVKTSRKVLVETDSMGHDVFFWALTGRTCTAILDYLLIASRVLHRPRGRSVLHSAIYAAPETVKYILSKPYIAALVNHQDHYHEDDEWAVYYSLDESAMAEMSEPCLRWVVTKLDRNRMMCRLPMAETRQDLEELATIKFEGKGDEFDQQSFDQAKAGYRSFIPDRSPLHYAAEKGNFVLAEGLLNKGADVNMKDRFGMTPLHTAVKHGDGELVELLCRRGADRARVDNTNSTALEIARDNGHARIEQLLE